jgi:hypothetical protein
MLKKGFNHDIYYLSLINIIDLSNCRDKTNATVFIVLTSGLSWFPPRKKTGSIRLETKSLF